MVRRIEKVETITITDGELLDQVESSVVIGGDRQVTSGHQTRQVIGHLAVVTGHLVAANQANQEGRQEVVNPGQHQEMVHGLVTMHGRQGRREIHGRELYNGILRSNVHVHILRVLNQWLGVKRSK